MRSPIDQIGDRGEVGMGNAGKNLGQILQINREWSI